MAWEPDLISKVARWPSLQKNMLVNMLETTQHCRHYTQGLRNVQPNGKGERSEVCSPANGAICKGASGGKHDATRRSAAVHLEKPKPPHTIVSGL